MKPLFPAMLLWALGIAQAQSYTFVEFDVPGSTGTFPSGINNSGQIVGAYSDSAKVSHGFLRSADGATFTTIDAPGALPGTTSANGVNNLGQVVGSYRDAAGYHCFIRSASGAITSCDITGQPNFVPSAINDRGEIVGPASSLLFGGNGYLRSADGSASTLIQAPFFGDSYPTAINNAGGIAGYGLVGSSNSTVHGFLRSPGGSYTQFDLPGTTNYNRISGLNNLGKFAGYVSNSSGVGFVSNADGTFTLLANYPVSAINDSGQITGTRFDLASHAFIGSPGPVSTQPAIRKLLPGVITASGFGGAPSIAPGTWIEIYGQNLAPAARAWRASDFTGNTAPTSLDGITVSINGSPAYISYISPGQVNALVPSTVAAGTAQVTVTSGNRTSDPYTVTVNAFQPAMLALPPDVARDQSYLAAVFPDFVTYVLPPRYTNVPTRRAKAGDTIILFGTGFGPVSPDVPTGRIAAQASTLSAPVQVSFFGGNAGVPGRVTYAGVVPGTVGLYQINVVVPNIGFSPGETFDDSVDVSVSVNGTPAQVSGPPAHWLPIMK